MADWRTQMDAWRDRWQGAPLRLRIGLLAFVAVVVGVAVLASARLSKPSMTVLFAQLSQEDSARVEERLRNMGVHYDVDAEASAVLVPGDRVHELRLTLASEGIPSDSRQSVGFELFDAQRFGESEFSEQVKYHRALEGELSRTISHLSGVKSARVHLVLPRKSLFITSEASASASVVLHTRPGWKVRKEQVDGIVHLVASSVRGLTPQQVTVVDGEGRNLGGHADSEEEAATGLMAYRRKVELDKEHSVQQLLDNILGNGHAVVRVAADVSMTREEKTEEEYNPETVATRSFQVVEEATPGPDGSARGIPGAASNLPGGPAAEAQVGGTRNVTRRSETRNYEITKKTRKAIEPVGRIERLQVAVVVDGRWSKQGKSMQFQARSPAELARLKGIIASAVGIHDDRGDRVTIECVSLAASRPHTPRVVHWWEAVEDGAHHFRSYIPYLAAIVGLVLLTMFGSRLLRMLGSARTTPGTAMVLSRGAAGAFERSAAKMAAAADERSESTKELRRLTAQLTAQDPSKTARVVRGWLNEGAPNG